MMQFLFTLISFLMVFGILLSASCDRQPAGPAVSDLFGTWMMSTAVMTNTVTFHTSGTDRDSTATNNNTPMHFTNSNDFYAYYCDMTYYVQFDDNILGNTSMITDTGTWTLQGSELTIASSLSPNPYTATLDLNGNITTITTRVFSDSQPGPNAGDYILNHWDLAISAVKQ